MSSDYSFTLTDIRASTSKEGKRYARVRAIANGIDSYNSIFTAKARDSLISQILKNGIGTKILHTDDVFGNVSAYLDMRASKASPEEKVMIQKLKGQLPLARFPVGKVVEAKFLDDKTVEAIIEENVMVKDLGAEEAKYLDTAWKMVEDKVIRGVSVVFNNVKSFVQDGKTFIDDLILTSLDFVDKAAHPDTEVIETFMRAAQENVAEEPNMTENEQKKPETQPVEVDKLVDKAVAEKLAQKEAEAKAKAEAEAKEQEIAAKLQTLESEKQAIENERAEAVELAKEAIEKLKEEREKVAHKSNPYYDTAKQQASQGADPLDGKSLAELMALQDKIIRQ